MENGLQEEDDSFGVAEAGCDSYHIKWLDNKRRRLGKVSHDGIKASHTFHCIASFCIISDMIIDNYHSTSKVAMSYLLHLSTSNSVVYICRSHGAWVGRWALA